MKRESKVEDGRDDVREDGIRFDARNRVHTGSKTRFLFGILGDLSIAIGQDRDKNYKNIDVRERSAMFVL